MGKELTIIALGATALFSLWYLSKEGCKGDGSNGITGPEGSLCWSGDSLQDMLGGLGGGGTEDIEAMEEEVEDVGDRNAVRQITPPEKRGIVSRTHTSDPVSTGGGVGGPSDPDDYKASWARAYYVNNRVTVA